jgi:4-hydroxythreonine-4-phosphate dehydrogenase
VNNRAKPLIAITMGDAAGIGPEVIIKACLSGDLFDICRPFVIGESRILQKAVDLIKAPTKLQIIHSLEEIEDQPGKIDLIDLHNLAEKEVIIGKVCPACGKASLEYIYKAVDLALQKKVGALVTAPINKEAASLAGCHEMGHMEIFARLTGVKEYATMLVSGPLRVVHLTTHHSLSNALNFVTCEMILARLKLTWESFRRWGIEEPCIGVAALNPHGGEGGLLGREEIDEIEPALKMARQMGIDARGPYPADSIFNRALKGEFTAVLAMYHDQGHIPIKVHGFERSVSVALGFPFIRTSVDHGTAFDIAWKGMANAESMIEAIKVAAGYCTMESK